MSNETAGKCGAVRVMTIRNTCSLEAGHPGDHSEESRTAPSDPMDDGVRWTSWPERAGPTPSMQAIRERFKASCAAHAYRRGLHDEIDRLIERELTDVLEGREPTMTRAKAARVLDLLRQIRESLVPRDAVEPCCDGLALYGVHVRII
jgi:hypothetical protein